MNEKKSISELNPQADQHHSDLHQPSQHASLHGQKLTDVVFFI